MTNMKKYLVVAMAALTMTLGSNMAAYAAEAAAEHTETESTENIEADVIENANTESTENIEAKTAENTAENTASQTKVVSLGTFRTTAYCPCYGCSEGHGRHTSTGKIARANHTIAVDPRVIPYGSKVMIDGIVYTAEDCGGGVKGNHIDIFFDTHSQTRQHGSRCAEVFLIV